VDVLQGGYWYKLKYDNLVSASKNLRLN